MAMNSTHDTYRQRLQSLRKRMNEEGLAAFLLPLTDEFQGEYSAAYARRVTWLCGFDGSAGMAVVGLQQAGLLVDGRYTLQAEKEVDARDWHIFNSGNITVAAYVSQAGIEGTIGYDPWLMTWQQIDRMQSLLPSHCSLLAVSGNPIDAIWSDQPSRPEKKIFLHPQNVAGRSMESKLDELAAVLREKGVDAFLVTQPDALCWLLNIRGGDIPFNPLPVIYGIAYADGRCEVFASEGRFSVADRAALSARVIISSPDALPSRIEEITSSHVVGMDPATVPVWFRLRCEAVNPKAVKVMPDPVLLMKAIKNPVEQQGTRTAHRLDGAAVTRFLCWIDQLQDAELPDEVEIAAKLESFRKRSEDYRGASFATIAGTGPNGAIVHYRALEGNCRRLAKDDVLLLDSGGQYPSGTTDITRTIARGRPPQEFREHFTRVLKGHIALATAVFPAGTSGVQLDVLARLPLWQAGLDYDHGTGHGVGSYLCVHEGPQRISKKGSDVALRPGMILSNEPGYYLAGQYGIRIENLVMVQEVAPQGGRNFLCFETLTLCPIDTRLMIQEWLNEAERAWLNQYHATVCHTLEPLLDAHERAWLQERTQPI